MTNNDRDSFFAGLGPTDPNALHKERRRAEIWEGFRQLAKFKIGDKASVMGKTITLTGITPVGGGLVRIQGFGSGVSIDGKYPPTEVSQP